MLLDKGTPLQKTPQNPKKDKLLHCCLKKQQGSTGARTLRQGIQMAVVVWGNKYLRQKEKSTSEQKNVQKSASNDTKCPHFVVGVHFGLCN